MPADNAAARARLRLFFPPITMILVSIPLILNLIPRNSIYGFRTHEAMASDAAWYPANRIGEMKARVLVLDHVYLEHFTPSIPPGGFINP